MASDDDGKKKGVKKAWSGRESEVRGGSFNSASSRIDCRGGESHAGEAAELRRSSSGASAAAGRSCNSKVML